MKWFNLILGIVLMIMGYYIFETQTDILLLICGGIIWFGGFVEGVVGIVSH